MIKLERRNWKLSGVDQDGFYHKEGVRDGTESE